MSESTAHTSSGETPILETTTKGHDEKSASKRLTHNAYTVGWVCALPKEQTASVAMLDEIHESLPTPNDHNVYVLGSIGNHNIVIVCLPFGRIGNNPSAVVATRMVATFPSIRFGLMVGIGGGIPPKVRLGDVVVSKPIDRFPGVVQWDMGKAEKGGKFSQTGALNSPPSVLLAALGLLYTSHEMNGPKIPQYLDDLKRNWPKLAPKYIRSGSLNDVLFAPSNPHRTHRTQRRWPFLFETIWMAVLAFLAFLLGWWTISPAKYTPQLTGKPTMNAAVDGDAEEDECRFCDVTKVIHRKPREMRVHYGLIASGNQVIKDAKFRDDLNQRFDQNILCVEMEAAGLMNDFPCIVVRGICDYADSHKNKAWQEYAAAVAAAYAKELLSVVPAQDVGQMPVIEILADLKQVTEEHRNIAKKQLDIQEQAVKQKLSDKQEKCLQLFRLTSGDKDVTYEWYKERIEHRVEGTCAWFLTHPNFQSWLKQTSGPLLVSADPGCGKSVLAKYLIDHVFSPSTAVCYFFFKEEDQNTVRQALCALLHQLLSKMPSLIHHAMEIFEKEGSKLIHLEKSLWTILEEVVRDPELGPVIIVLDALDECAESDFRNLLLNVRRQFPGNQSEYGKLRYLLTSRPYHRVVSKFRSLEDDFWRIYIPGEEEADAIGQEVNLVIQHRVEQLAKEKELSDQVKAHLTKRLLGIKHRTYLWVYLVFDYLESESFKKTSKGVDAAIETLPKSVNQAYEQILSKRNDSEDRSAIKKALSIVLAASRPLTLSEMNIAMNMDATSQSTCDLDLENDKDFKARLRFLCGLFISVHHDQVYFLHQTAREFLLADLPSVTSVGSEPQWHGCVTIRDAHTVLAEVCIRYLGFFDSDSSLSTNTNTKISNPTRIYSFLDYSAKYWALHLRKADITSEGCGTTSIALRISHPESRSYSEWFPVYWNTQPGLDPQYSTQLVVASHFGHYAIVKLLIDKGADPKEQWKRVRSALFAASEQGHEQVVELLLNRGAGPNAQGKSGYNALYVAAHRGHKEIVELLLNRGASPNAQGKSGQNALNVAALRGHKEIVELLLNRGAEPNALGRRGQNALYGAAFGGHKEVVELLLNRGADPTAQGGSGYIALYAAALRGHKEVVELLLNRGADPNTQDMVNGYNALYAAASRGHKEIVELLLDRGANQNVLGRSRYNALDVASLRGFKQVVELLLNRGADLNVQGGSISNALSAAAIEATRG